MTYDTWGTRPAGSRPKPLDRTPQQLTRIRTQALAVWTILFDLSLTAQLGSTIAVQDLSTLTGLDPLYVRSLVGWVAAAEHPDVVDLYVDDQPEA